MGFWQYEDGEAFGDISFEPFRELWCGIAIGGDEHGECGLGSGDGIGVPDGPEFSPDAFADSLIRGMVDGVLGEVELAALPLGGAEHGAAGGMQSGVVVRRR